MIRMLFKAIILICLFSNCSLINPQRTFHDEMDRDEDGAFVPRRDFPVVSGDPKKDHRSMQEVWERTPSSLLDNSAFTEQRSLARELQELEDELPQDEYEHYHRFSDQLKSISEKIYFLRLKSTKERNRYMLSRTSIKGDRNFYKSNEMEWATQNREILMGMDKDTVMRSWGKPMRIDVAGNPRYENERWAFYDRGKLFYVFFENGRVRGWEEKN